MAHQKPTTIDPDVPVQPSFPTDLPPRTAPGTQQSSWHSRHCPGMRNCWSFSLSSYSLRNVSPVVRLRRICMLTILALRTAISVISVIGAVVSGHVASAVIYAIIGAIGLWFIAWCLARIGDCVGERKVLGVMVGRWHFDVFLLACAVLHIGLIIGFFFWKSAWGTQLVWLVMWLAIFAVAWIAGWEPEPIASNV